MHPLAFYLLLLPLSAQVDVYKCLDHRGKVTYTNSACAKVGLKEAKVIPPPPPPAVDARAKAVSAAKPTAAKASPAPEPKQAAVMQLAKSQASDACGKLDADMGDTLDAMDAARSRGATPQQQAAWNAQLERFQAEKNRLGCF